jgi:mRNA interferase MazF
MEPGDIIKVPFPYTNRPVFQRRPALVVARIAHERTPTLLWVLMVTSAENRGWPGDVEITDLPLAGLPVASVIRTAKIATIEEKDAEKLGKAGEMAWQKVKDYFLGALLKRD